MRITIKRILGPKYNLDEGVVAKTQFRPIKILGSPNKMNLSDPPVLTNVTILSAERTAGEFHLKGVTRVGGLPMMILMEMVPREEVTGRDLPITVLGEQTRIPSPGGNQEETIKDPPVVILLEEDRTMESSKTKEAQREIRARENGSSIIKSTWEPYLNGMVIRQL